MHRLTRFGISNGEFTGVEVQTAGIRRGFGRLGRAVQHIADDGQTDGREMDAQLMCAAGDGFEFKAGAIWFQGEEAIACLAGAAADVVNDLHGSAIDVGAHGKIDETGFGRWHSSDQGDVALSRGASFELHSKVALCIGIEAKDQEAGSVHIESVDDEWAGGMRKMGRDTSGGTVLLVRALARNAQHSSGLVDDDKAT